MPYIFLVLLDSDLLCLPTSICFCTNRLPFFQLQLSIEVHKGICKQILDIDDKMFYSSILSMASRKIGAEKEFVILKFSRVTAISPHLARNHSP